MKKLVASALLAGLFLGTATPVFAQTTLNQGAETGSTPVTSEITTLYTVTIPESLSIDLIDSTNDTQEDSEGTVTLTKLTSAGKIDVEAVSETLKLTPESLALNEILEVTLTNGEINNTEKLTKFSLSNNDTKFLTTQKIKIGTTEENKDNKPGKYAGNIVFKISYIMAE